MPSRSLGLRVAATGVVLAAAVAVASLGIQWAPPIPSGSPGPTPPRPTPPRPSSSRPPVTVPPPTYPPAMSWTIGDAVVDLPPGWSVPPDARTLAIIAALDQLHDPDAGVFNMMLAPGRIQASGLFRFHISDIGVRSDAGIHAWVVASSGSTAASAASEAEATLEAEGYTVTRSRLTLPIGRAVRLDWDRAYNGPALHFRAVFFVAGESVVRIDLGTVGPTSESMAAEFLAILQSARSTPPASASP